MIEDPQKCRGNVVGELWDTERNFRIEDLSYTITSYSCTRPFTEHLPTRLRGSTPLPYHVGSNTHHTFCIGVPPSLCANLCPVHHGGRKCVCISHTGTTL